MEDDNNSVIQLFKAHPFSYCTDTTVSTYEHTWIIQKLDLCDKHNLKSAEYSSGDNKKIKWHWYLGLGSNANPLIGLYLSIISDYPLSFMAKVEIITDGKSSTPFKKKGTANNSDYTNCVETKRNGDSSSLKFNIELTFIEEFKCSEDKKATVPDCNVSNYWTHLLDDKEFADVTIVVGGEEFLAHKAVLASRSSVFRAMLKNEMVESTQNKVTITDILPQVFEQLLRFIYTDSVEGLDTTMAFELLQAADKYDLEKLKTRCEAALCGQISENTAVNTLVLADLYRADQLRRAVVNYIGRNVGVIQTEEWKNLMMKNFDLANEVVIELLKGIQLK